MTTHPPVSNATDSPLRLGEGLGRRVEPVETVRSRTMFAAGVGTLKGLKLERLVKRS